MSPGAWLVTGASGFLGRQLLHSIAELAPGRKVVGLVRDRAAWRAMDWTGGLRDVLTVTGSVTEPEPWRDEAARSQVAGIFHLAAEVRHAWRDAELVERTAVDGTLAMVRLAAGWKCRLVFVSTSGTVGCFRRPGLSADEDAPYCETEVAEWPYYRSKIQAEKEARDLAAGQGVDLVIARPPVLLGPGDHKHRATAHVSRMLEGRLPFVIRGGMHFADVRDVARALVRMMALPEARPVYHLPGTVCTIEEFYAMVGEAAGLPVPRVVPYRVAWVLASLNDRVGRALRGRPLARLPDPSLVEMASRHWSVHSRYSANELGYASRPGPETIADTVAGLR